ncbi:MAG: YIP1 family protein [Gammaproteobacteria bacterium]|nr:YIP1 family protein [Gammaproteobacteria bacterium]
MPKHLTPHDALLLLLGQQQRVFKRRGWGARCGWAGVFWGSARGPGLRPPLCAYLGARRHGWRLGPGEPLYMSDAMALAVSGAYFAAMLAGFFLATALAAWMARSYAARNSLGHCGALIALAGTPFALGGVFHLYPSLALNLGVLIPASVWSAALLYAGLPKILRTNSARGMLMASSLIGVLLVALAGLLALTMLLWVNGLGPGLAV